MMTKLSLRRLRKKRKTQRLRFQSKLKDQWLNLKKKWCSQPWSHWKPKVDPEPVSIWSVSLMSVDPWVDKKLNSLKAQWSTLSKLLLQLIDFLSLHSKTGDKDYVDSNVLHHKTWLPSINISIPSQEEEVPTFVQALIWLSKPSRSENMKTKWLQFSCCQMDKTKEHKPNSKKPSKSKKKIWEFSLFIHLDLELTMMRTWWQRSVSWKTEAFISSNSWQPWMKHFVMLWVGSFLLLLPTL